MPQVRPHEPGRNQDSTKLMTLIMHSHGAHVLKPMENKASKGETEPAYSKTKQPSVVLNHAFSMSCSDPFTK